MSTTTEKPTTIPAPGQPDSPVELKERYDNFIGGHWIAPAAGGYHENHRMMLDHYSQTKCLLVSYDRKPLGFF